MKKIVILFLGCVVLFGCKDSKNTDKSTGNNADSTRIELQKKDRSSLIEIKNGEYREYYPGKEKLKIHGYMDDNQLRTGKWSYYSENGAELSVITYEDGKREGYSVVHYPNGAVYYSGEYHADKKVGEWKFYDEQGKVTVKQYD